MSMVGVFASRLSGVRDIDTGSLRDDLVAMARQVLHAFLDESGGAVLRLMLEAESIPSGREHLDRFLHSQVAAARAIVHRGIDRGQVSGDISVTLLLNTISGGALNHALTTPARSRVKVAAGADRYAEELVDFVLASVPVTEWIACHGHRESTGRHLPKLSESQTAKVSPAPLRHEIAH